MTENLQVTKATKQKSNSPKPLIRPGSVMVQQYKQSGNSLYVLRMFIPLILIIVTIL